MPVNSIEVDDENFHASEKVFISVVRPPVLICELSKYKEGEKGERQVRARPNKGWISRDQ